MLLWRTLKAILPGSGRVARGAVSLIFRSSLHSPSARSRSTGRPCDPRCLPVSTSRNSVLFGRSGLATTPERRPPPPQIVPFDEGVDRLHGVAVRDRIHKIERSRISSNGRRNDMPPSKLVACCSSRSRDNSLHRYWACNPRRYTNCTSAADAIAGRTS